MRKWSQLWQNIGIFCTLIQFPKSVYSWLYCQLALNNEICLEIVQNKTKLRHHLKKKKIGWNKKVWIKLLWLFWFPLYIRKSFNYFIQYLLFPSGPHCTMSQKMVPNRYHILMKNTCLHENNFVYKWAYTNHYQLYK